MQSTNPNPVNSTTSGLPGHENPTNTYSSGTAPGSTTTANEQGGVIPSMLNYVGLGGNSNSQSTADATNEPAFGAAVGPGSGSSVSGLGAGAGSSGSYAAPTLNPHDEDRARHVADRATVGHGPGAAGLGGVGSGVGRESGYQGSGVGSGVGLESGRETGHLGSGVGSGVGLESGHRGSGVGSGVGLESGRETGHHGSGVGSGVGLESSRVGSGVGLESGRETGHHGSGVGSGVGLGSERTSGSLAGGVGSDSLSGRDNVQSSTTDNVRHGSTTEPREGAVSQEAKTESTNLPSSSGGSKGKLENKDSIPTAGGVQLGEKHWGESDIVPEVPKTREADTVASAEGQPDQSTRDNTSANTGDAHEHHGSDGQHKEKEGMMDKVKDKLHIGSHK